MKAKPAKANSLGDVYWKLHKGKQENDKSLQMT